MKKAVGPAGATLRSANGDITLVLEPGTFALPKTVGVAEVGVAPASPAGSIRVAPYFNFTPDGTSLAVPAKATVRYRVPVTHFQVASTLAPYINMVSYNPASSRWENALTTVTTSTATFTGVMTHFSYWSGTVVQPHGIPPRTANYCSAICHDLVISPTNRAPLISTDKQICYNCHGNISSTEATGAGTNGPNIQAEFIDEPDQSFDASAQSRHPAGALKCSACHNQHRDPARYYKQLRVKDAVTGLWVEPSRDTSTVGNAFCWACHGTIANAAIEASVPGYYSRTGDKKSNLTGTPHDNLTAPTASGIKCLACHTDHGAANNSLVATQVAGKAVTGNNNTLCRDACHEDPAGNYPGETAYSQSSHGGYPVLVRKLSDFNAGTHSGTITMPNGDLEIGFGDNLTLSMSYTKSAEPTFWGDTDPPTIFTDGNIGMPLLGYRASDLGVSFGATGTVDITVDLGSSTWISGAQIYGHTGDRAADVLEILTSEDGITYTPRGVGSPSGVDEQPLPVSFDRVEARYVTFRAAKPFTANREYFWIAEGQVFDRLTSGSWTSPVVDVSAADPVMGSTVSWDASVPASGEMSVWTNLSLDGGSTWEGLQPAANGGPIPGLAYPADLSNARVQYTVDMTKTVGSPSPEVGYIRSSVSFDRAETWAAETLPGSDYARSLCHNCHDPHGKGNPDYTRASGGDLCDDCHEDASASPPADYSYLGETTYTASAHGTETCGACHATHGSDQPTSDPEKLLAKEGEETCYECHDDPVNSENGINIKEKFTQTEIPEARHSVSQLDQDTRNSKIECTDCHDPHVNTSTAKVIDPDSPTESFEATMVNPVGLAPPAEEETDVPIIADTTLDMANPTFNYGVSDEVLVDSTHNGLLRPDTSTLPEDIYITSAELRVYAPDSSRDDTVVPRSATVPWSGTTTMFWNEGTGDGVENTDTVNGATWYEMWYGDNANDGRTGWANNPDADWGTPGGSTEESWTEDVNYDFKYVGPFSRSDFAAQDPVDPWARVDITGIFNGLYQRRIDSDWYVWPYWYMDGILLEPETPGAKLYMESREAADTSRRPYVHVKYYQKPSVRLEPDKDTYIDRDLPSATYGASSELQVGDTGDIKRALLHFDLSSIPSSATISSARLYLRAVWPTYVDVAPGEWQLHRMTRDWNEGTGTGEDNNTPTPDGASWLEWQYHDNSRTPLDVDSGDWTAEGGDFDPTVLGQNDGSSGGGSSTYRFEARNLVQKLVEGPNYGFTIKAKDGRPLRAYSAEHGVLQFRPYLEVTYGFGEPQAVPDSIEFCTRCHDLDPPAGVTVSHAFRGVSPEDIISDYDRDVHGPQSGHGTGHEMSQDGTATLKPPYYFGMGPLPCTECHDPHGSRNAYHLKEEINGSTGLRVYMRDWSRVSNSDDGVYRWCSACHNDVRHQDWAACLECHEHPEPELF